MRTFLFVGLISSLMVVVRAAEPVRTPVIVELFTSEGCSSCPPADALLMRLEQTQPVEGAEIIALSEHVDYWNRLGWADPFSSPRFSQRQTEYSRQFMRDGVYTPQMVVDGAAEFVGSNGLEAVIAIRKAAAGPKARIRASSRRDGDSLVIPIEIDSIPPGAKAADVVLAISENGLVSNVSRGENAGSTLRHRAVVRRLEPIGRITSGAYSGEARVKLEKNWRPDQLSVVIFVQERVNRRILGAARVAAKAL